MQNVRILVLGAMAFILAVTQTSSAQTIGSTTPNWIPDFSHEPFPVNNPKHRFTNDNNGNPKLDEIDYAQETRREDEDMLLDMSFQSVEIGDGNTALVYVSRRKSTETNPTTGEVKIVPDSRRVYLRIIAPNGSTNSDIAVGEGTTQESLPQVVVTENGKLMVCYRSLSSSGARLFLRRFTGGGAVDNTFNGGVPLSVTGSTVFNYISELCLSRDEEDGALIAFTASLGNPHSNIFKTQWIDQNANTMWGSTGRTSCYRIGVSEFVYNPIIKWNPYEGNRILIACGRSDYNTGAGNSYIYAQEYAFSPVYDSLFSGGMTPLLSQPGIPLQTPVHHEFYMEWGRSLNIKTDVLLLMSTGNEYPRLLSYTFASTHSINWSVHLSTTEKSLGAALDVYSVLRSGKMVDDPVAVYGKATRSIQRVNCTNGVPVYTSAIIASPGSERFTSMIAHTSTHTYVTIPGLNQAVMARVDGSGTVNALTIPLRCAPDQTGPLSSYGDAYFSMTLSPTDGVKLITFEYGMSPFQNTYLTEGIGEDRSANFKQVMQGGLHQPAFRCEGYAQNTKLSYQRYDLTSALTPLLTNPVVLQGSGVQHGLHSAAYEHLIASTWETFYDDGSVDVFLGYWDPTALQYQTMNVTNRLNSDYKYIRPKVGVYSAGGNDYAYITFNGEFRIGLTDYSGLYYSVVDLNTGLLVVDKQMIHQVYGLWDIRNYDVVLDQVTGCLLAIFSKGHGGPSPREIASQRINASGTLSGPSYSVSVASYNTINQVSCTPNPDLLNPGAYVVWHEVTGLGQHRITLNAVRSSGGTWAAPIVHTNPGLRYQPTVAATKDWVMLAWADEYTPGIPAGRPRIYACVRNNAGVLLPGWLATGNLVTAPTFPYAPGSSNYEAFEPDLIVGQDHPVSGACIVAFSEDEDPTWTNFGTTSPRRVGVRRIDIAGTLGTQHNLTFGQSVFPSNDVTNGLFGFMQRKPKLTRMTVPDLNSPFPPMPYILCAFQTMPYLNTGAAGHGYNALELAQHTNNLPMFSQSNISARLIDPSGTQSPAHYCIASGTNAQDLENIHWTLTHGFKASLMDYDNSDNHAGDVQLIDIFDAVSAPFDRDLSSHGTWTIMPPLGLTCGDPNPGIDITNGPFYIVNPSPIPLNVSASFNVMTGPAFAGEFSSDMSSVIPPFSFADNNITYQPTVFRNCTPSNFEEHVQMTYFFGGPPALYRLSTGVAAKTTTNAAVAEAGEFMIKLFPNPSSGPMNLSVEGEIGRVEVRVMNALGQMVEQRTVSGQIETELDLSHLSSGSYFIQCSDEAGRVKTISVRIER